METTTTSSSSSLPTGKLENTHNDSAFQSHHHHHHHHEEEEEEEEIHDQDPAMPKGNAVTATGLSPEVVTTTMAAVEPTLWVPLHPKAGLQQMSDQRRQHMEQILAHYQQEQGASSRFLQKQARREQELQQRIEQLQRQHQQFYFVQQQQQRPPPPIQHSASSSVSVLLENWQRQRPGRSTCVVVDMDMFYMACELLTRPDLQQVPACVGRGIILTSNYAARQYGVRSAMAGWLGDLLVTELSQGQERLIHVPAHHDLYREKSQILQAVVSEYDPWALSSGGARSLDEVYLQLAPYVCCRLQHPQWTHQQIHQELLLLLQQQQQQEKDASPPPVYPSQPALESLTRSYAPHTCDQAVQAILSDLRRTVYQRTGGLTCSAGVGPNFLLAKMASEVHKPNGQFLVPSDREGLLEFLHPRPVRQVPGIGRVMERLLQAVDIHTVRDLYQQRHLIHFLFPPATAHFLLRVSVGCDTSSSSGGLPDDPGKKDDGPKRGRDHPIRRQGISRERTFGPGRSWTDLHRQLEELGQQLAQDMEREDLYAQTITLKVKLHTFDVISKARTLPRGRFVHQATELIEVALELLHQVRADFERAKKATTAAKRGRPRAGTFSVRLLGLRCSQFQDPDQRREQEHQHRQWAGFLASAPAETSGPTSSSLGPEDGEKGESPDPKPSRARPAPAKSSAPQQMTIDRFVAKSVVRTTPASSSRVLGDEKPHRPAQIDSSSLMMMVSCPICGKNLSSRDNAALNRHVDACLGETRER